MGNVREGTKEGDGVERKLGESAGGRPRTAEPRATGMLIPYSPRLSSQYCQTIRNNNNKNRTPKWAVKYGLVRVKDKRGGKHLWAGRYDGAQH